MPAGSNSLPTRFAPGGRTSRPDETDGAGKANVTVDVSPKTARDAAAMDLDLSTFVELQKELRAKVDRYGLPGYVFSVTKNQQPVFEDVYGLRDIGRNAKVDRDTLFRQYSMTKALVSVVAMTFYDEGLVRLDDCISKFLGDAWRPATSKSSEHEAGLRVTTWDGIVRGSTDGYDHLEVRQDDTLYIVARTPHQRTLDVDPSGSARFRWEDRGAWQALKSKPLPPTPDGRHRIAFRAHTGKFLTLGDSACVTAASAEPSAWIVHTAEDVDSLLVGQVFKLQHEQSGKWLRVVDEPTSEDQSLVPVGDAPVATEFVFEKQTWLTGKTEPARECITLRHLLTHTSGLDYSGMDSVPVTSLDFQARPLVERCERGEITTLAAWVDELAKLPLRYHPGTKFEYGYSTDVLGRVVEVLGEGPLDEVLQRRLFGPLGMHSTSFSATPTEARDRLSALYQFPNGLDYGSISVQDDPLDSQWTPPRGPAPILGAGGGVETLRGGLLSTAPDYMRFCHMLEGGGELDGVRVLRASTVDLMTKVNHLSTIVSGHDSSGPDRVDPCFTIWDERGWGLLGSIELPAEEGSPDNPCRNVGAYGWGGWASTGFRVYPSSNVSYVFMTNCIDSINYEELILKHVGQAIRGKRPPTGWRRVPAALSSWVSQICPEMWSRLYWQGLLGATVLAALALPALAGAWPVRFRRLALRI